MRAADRLKFNMPQENCCSVAILQHFPAKIFCNILKYMLNNNPKYYSSISFLSTQKFFFEKRFILGPYSGVTP